MTNRTVREPQRPGGAKVALAALAEVRRRLDEDEAAGLRGEVERVRRIAKAVLALCGHHDVLSSLRTYEALPADEAGRRGGLTAARAAKSGAALAQPKSWKKIESAHEAHKG
ncbi:DUF6415 family natural product biosynthesis protein [Streptomyces seoulensis]